jgi:hypothetical protein
MRFEMLLWMVLILLTLNFMYGCRSPKKRDQNVRPIAGLITSREYVPLGRAKIRIGQTWKRSLFVDANGEGHGHQFELEFVRTAVEPAVESLVPARGSVLVHSLTQITDNLGYVADPAALQGEEFELAIERSPRHWLYLEAGGRRGGMHRGGRRGPQRG